MYDTDSLIDRIRELEGQLSEDPGSPITTPIQEWRPEPGGEPEEIEYLEMAIRNMEEMNSCLPIYNTYEKCGWSHEVVAVNKKMMAAMKERIKLLKKQQQAREG